MSTGMRDAAHRAAFQQACRRPACCDRPRLRAQGWENACRRCGLTEFPLQSYSIHCSLVCSCLHRVLWPLCKAVTQPAGGWRAIPAGTPSVHPVCPNVPLPPCASSACAPCVPCVS